MARKAKKNHIGIFSKMLASFVASDAAPEEIEEAVDAIEDITAPETSVPAGTVPPEGTDADPEEDPVESRLKALEDSIEELKQFQKGTDEPEEETDPLARLEKDLDTLEGAGEEEPAEEEPINPDEDPDEQESHFVDPEEINEQDADETVEEEVLEEEETADCKARDAVRDTIKAIKPFIAKLPKAEQKKAVDALSARLRKVSGKSGDNGYTKLLKARKKTGDSKKGSDPRALGDAIMASRNSNYTK